MSRFQTYLKNYQGTPSIERVFNDAYTMGYKAGLAEVDHPKRNVIAALLADPRRSVYCASNGLFYVDYSAGLPGFSLDAVKELVEDGYLTATDYEGAYNRGPQLDREP